MNFDESKVFIIRLTSNEELVALVDDSEAALKVHVPFQIGLRAQPTQALDGRPNVNIHMAPYLPLSDEDTPLEIPASIVALKYKPNRDIIQKYKEIYVKMTSNLVLPPGI